MGQLTVHPGGDGALLQHDNYLIRPLGQGRHVQIDQPLPRVARCAEIDLVLVHRSAARMHLLDERQQRAAERHKVVQTMAAQ